MSVPIRDDRAHFKRATSCSVSIALLLVITGIVAGCAAPTTLSSYSNSQIAVARKAAIDEAGPVYLAWFKCTMQSTETLALKTRDAPDRVVDNALDGFIV